MSEIRATDLAKGNLAASEAHSHESRATDLVKGNLAASEVAS